MFSVFPFFHLLDKMGNSREELLMMKKECPSCRLVLNLIENTFVDVAVVGMTVYC